MRNFYANIAGAGGGPRDPDDQYETPCSVTEALLAHVIFHDRVLEPACGTGQMVRALSADGYKVTSTNLQEGHDFLELERWDGSIVTNPPYHRRLAEAFVRHALSLTDESVAFLVRDRLPQLPGPLRPVPRTPAEHGALRHAADKVLPPRRHEDLRAGPRPLLGGVERADASSPRVADPGGVPRCVVRGARRTSRPSGPTLMRVAAAVSKSQLNHYT